MSVTFFSNILKIQYSTHRKIQNKHGRQVSSTDVHVWYLFSLFLSLGISVDFNA